MLKFISAAFLTSVLLLLGCQTDHRCKYKPEPVFAAGLPHISAYNYEVQGSQSLESVLLDDKVLLEINQDVCDHTRQEFRITVPGDRRQIPDSLWLKEAARQMVVLSALSPKQSPLKAWGDIIEERRPEMKLGEDYPVQSGITIRVDRILSPEQSVLLIVLGQE
ncbi:MAG: hypothetical protein ABIO24_12585 [Saprospiraceae bacterium]